MTIASRRVLPFALIGLFLAAAVGVLAAIYLDVPTTLQHRLDHSVTLGSAHLEPPNLGQWPRLSVGRLLVHCAICTQDPQTGPDRRTVVLGWLVKDEAVTQIGESNAPNRPHSAAEVPLPRLVWVVQWPDRCWAVSLPGVHACTTYDIIDDATGYELDTSQTRK